MNYGAELQAFALQKKLNLLGADAEVIHIEKEKWAMQGSYWTILTAIKKRIQIEGFNNKISEEEKYLYPGATE